MVSSRSVNEPLKSSICAYGIVSACLTLKWRIVCEAFGQLSKGDNFGSGVAMQVVGTSHILDVIIIHKPMKDQNYTLNLL